MPPMKSYPSFDAYLGEQVPRNQKIIAALRKFVRRAAPELTEAVKWGNGCWLAASEPIAYVYSDTECVQFGFVMGSKLNDPTRLLEGTGRFVRHIKVRSASDIDQVAFSALLKQAAQLRRPQSGRADRRHRRAVDAYIATHPVRVQRVLRRVRGIIRKALPGASEDISYGIPCHKLGGCAVYFAAWKRHWSLYPVTADVRAALGDALDEYEVSKGTVRFSLSDPVPVRLVTRIVKALRAGAAERQRTRRPRVR